jgi:hypothetical protein
MAAPGRATLARAATAPSGSRRGGGVAVVMLDIGQQTDVRALHGNHLDAEAAPRSSLQGALRFC